jgi:subtilisin family serine protease
MRKLALFLAVFLFLNQTTFAVETEDSVKIAIVDTGISTKALGRAQIAQGKNYILPNQDTEDKINHGTAIASLIVGKSDRKLVGAYPEATLVPLVYFSLEDKSVVKGDATMLAQCIYDAVDVFSCRVINLSAGILIDSTELKDACEYAEEKGAVIVSAVGNDHKIEPQNLYYPAAYDTVIGVGALNESGKVAGFSQRNTSVSLVTNGEDLWVARASGTMTHVSGTSYACSFVSAAAARLLAENPDLSPSEVRSILYEAANDLGEVGFDLESGYGALNLQKAMELAKDYQWFSDYAVPVLQWAVGVGIMKGNTEKTLNPKGNATRAEVVIMILNYLNSTKQ